MSKKKLTETEKYLSDTYLKSHKELTDKMQMHLAIVQCFIKKQNQYNVDSFSIIHKPVSSHYRYNEKLINQHNSKRQNPICR